MEYYFYPYKKNETNRLDTLNKYFSNSKANNTLGLHTNTDISLSYLNLKHFVYDYSLQYKMIGKSIVVYY